LILSSHQKQSITLERTTIIYLSLSPIQLHKWAFSELRSRKGIPYMHAILIFTFRIMKKYHEIWKALISRVHLLFFFLSFLTRNRSKNMIHKTRVTCVCTWEIIILGLYLLTWPLSLCEVMVIRAHSRRLQEYFSIHLAFLQNWYLKDLSFFTKIPQLIFWLLLLYFYFVN
jgi:hypothetical protein